MKNNLNSKLERAKLKVANLKGFYNHLVVYIIINLSLIIFKEKVIFTLLSKEAIGNPDFLNWINWNVFGTPIIWGIGLLIHALFVFGSKPTFIKKWEQKQLQKYMREQG
tara:strand:- start:59080 stop:59406 length:327 start_codon:yes stop_codon:yes gene_type:complete